MKFRFGILGFLVLGFLSSCTEEPTIEEEAIDLDKELTESLINAAPNGRFFHWIIADENELHYLPNQDPHNPVTREKVKLGKFLFFETGMAQDAKDERSYETYSCATCHIPEAGFLPGRFQGVADGAHGFGFQGSVREVIPGFDPDSVDAQGIRPLTVLNVAYMTNTLWSGLFGSDYVNEGTDEYWPDDELAYVNQLGYTGLESQNIEGVLLHRMSVNDRVLDDFNYREQFDLAFPELDTAHRYSEETVSFALGAYLRTLLTTRAPFQDWLKGDKSALTESQKKGALLFFGEARCYKCHNSPALSSMTFHALGTEDLYRRGALATGPEERRNLGRAMLTGKEDDMFRFKVPQLYNVKDYVTFFHGSSKESLEEVLEYKIKAVSENESVSQDRISPLFQPLSLTEEDKEHLLDFLKNGLYDADYSRYVPEELPSGLCFPNNDPDAKRDMGCE